ncbi:MAG: BREX system Lon protease-like protein BrxL [Puniceicoccales bacterium]|jgi:ATP-dependent Lon protease|nr:BREX system Lon protease-like protein BrxL [Puniceicoccales bacterium]
MNSISQKIREVFPDIAILKNPDNQTAFSGRNLPSFVKDYLVKRFIDGDGDLDAGKLRAFLDRHIPANNTEVKGRLLQGETLSLLVRFIISHDIRSGETRFSIPDIGIKSGEGVIPDHVVREHREELCEGEKWGVIKLIYTPPGNREKGTGVVELAEYKPFRPYKVDLDYFKECRRRFSLEGWVDVLLSAMEYNPDGFDGMTQKLEFLARILVFVEPRLNMIELAPKGTGKSYVFGNLSKYGWLVSGGKVSRAKLFFDKQRQQPGIVKNYDFVTFDEIQTISFTDSSEMQAILKSYLESGKATVDNYEFLSECGMMLMGNLPLTGANRPQSPKYFSSLPDAFKESALLDRFHGFIEGWRLPRMGRNMVLHGWTLNVEYFSEILHALRTASEYGALVNELIVSEERSDLRDLKAVKRIATAYCKLLFPHITDASQVNHEDFERHCLQPAIRRRGIIKEQCHAIDPEFKEAMPEIRILPRS